MKPLRHGSLFSGIGAAEIAAEMLGWENVFHCEINPFGRQVLEYWFPNSDSYEDITKTDFSQYRGQIDVLTGGFPCQPFSYAGKRGGQTDDRYLWHEMLRVIDQVRPMWVIGENVNGITTMVESYSVTKMGSESSLFGEGDGVHRYRSEQTFTIERICRDLESKGYSVQPMLIPACAVGAPHRRDRIFILAYYVADTDCGNDLRESGEYESKSSKEGVSKRNKVRKPGKSNHVRSETEGFICDDRIRNVANSECERLERKNESQCSEGRKQMQIWGDITGYYRKAALQPQERWKAFPTVSPVSRRNDGIPFDVDSLAIPFGKWKVETIKAYGNAIVPQVIYQIMKVINDISKNN
jgi:DNA (cytosine-5)-methyltransferase 1